MVGSLLKRMAFSKAPRTSFALRHPVKAMRLRKLSHDLRHATAPRITALGAAALALPLGFMVGRLRSGRHVS